ncbi:MAG: methylmalonyl-CoA mutase family protein [Caulobacteraceae bacterium]
MDASTIPLADDFPVATRADWLAAVEWTLKGAGIDSLAGRTPDGLDVRALYTAADAPGRTAFLPAPRGAERAWDVRAAVAHPDPARANSQILEALAGGAGSVLVTIDPAGAGGVAVGSAEDLERLLDGVKLDLAPVALDAGFLGREGAQWLAAAAKASPAAPLALHLDPIGALAASGASPGPVEGHLAAAADLATRQADIYPRASHFLASGRAVHEAGGSPAAELAFAAACALAYAKALTAAGLPLATAFERIVLGLSVDQDALTSIAKLRAARIVWARIAGACGAAAPARIEARSSGRMLTRADPWTNLVRLTGAAFAAAVGGADAVIVGAFTDAIGSPTPPARRLALATQLIAMEEAHLGAVADPLGGAWAIEALTDDLARAAWSRFTAIEAAGGVVQALKSGAVAGEVDAERAVLKARLASGEIAIVGVTEFVNAAPTAPHIEAVAPRAAAAADPRLPGPDSHCPPLAPIHLEDLVA